MDRHKSPDPRTGRSRPPTDAEKARIEREENEDLEVDEDTGATKGSPESPDNTGAERKVAKQESGFDDAGDPDAIEEEMRNQDA